MHNKNCLKFLTVFLLLLLLSCSGKIGDGKDLLKAVDQGNLEKTVKLLKGGVDPNTVDSEGKSVLVRALKKKNETIALALLKYGATPNPSQGDEDIPLCIALEDGSEDIKMALLKSGADLSIPCEELDISPVGGFALSMSMKYTLPFLIALKNCDINVVDAILERMDKKARQAIDAQDLLKASSGFTYKNKKCVEVAGLVFSPDSDFGFCDEDIVFVEDKLHKGDEYALVDLDYDEKEEKIVSGWMSCGSCGCSFDFYKKIAGSWVETENIDCSAGNFRGSSRSFNGHKVLCTSNFPRYYWDINKEENKAGIKKLF